MKNIFEQVIARGGYDLNGILKRIDEYHVEGKLSDADRAHLIAAARGDARPQLNAGEELQRLWQAVKALEARLDKYEGIAVPDDVPDFVQPTGAHDAYFAGARVRWSGKVYECIAPAGAACVWSPDDMPAYWRAE